MAVGQTGEREVQIVVLSDPSARKHCYSTRYFIVTKDKLLVKKDMRYPTLSNKTIITITKLSNCNRVLIDYFFSLVQR